ncbi:MAG: hypothetical protein KatS3mg059_1710 [Thermomicrobiales bacterium]|nr:MAG: hypothetical protein KatS3mg059_1710 [Thermomicrobiales bacterium]
MANRSVTKGRGVPFSRDEPELPHVAVVADVESDRSTGHLRTVLTHVCGKNSTSYRLIKQVEEIVIQGKPFP